MFRFLVGFAAGAWTTYLIALATWLLARHTHRAGEH